jgi:hypothetical protein
VHPLFSVRSCYSTFSFMCMFCRSLFILLYFFFWPLCWLFFFELRILITPLVSSFSSIICHSNCGLLLSFGYLFLSHETYFNIYNSVTIAQSLLTIIHTHAKNVPTPELASLASSNVCFCNSEFTG